MFFCAITFFTMIPRQLLFLFTSQVGSESSHHAQVFLAAGLHGHYPALPRSHQVLRLSQLSLLLASSFMSG